MIAFQRTNNILTTDRKKQTNKNNLKLDDFTSWK